jgi:hypothetical protein
MVALREAGEHNSMGYSTLRFFKKTTSLLPNSLIDSWRKASAQVQQMP